jgi:phage FluMu gp28-like protein
LGSRPFSEALPPVLQLRPYQQRWIDDDARFKGAVKSARIGFTFATMAEAVLDCLERPKTTWTALGAAKAQAIEAVDAAQKIIQAMGAVAEMYDEPFADELGMTSDTQTRIQYANGSRIIALPANPRTARGYPGNAILDEFGHCPDSYAIWAAIARQVALGHKLRVLSTPNGEFGKFFDLAREFELIDGVEPAANPLRKGFWSWHWADINLAVREGCPIDIAQMRDLFKDEESFAQEFLCVFLKAVGSWLSLELIARAEDEGATMEWPPGYAATGPLYAGIDVGREGDRTVLWLDEQIGDVAWARTVLRLFSTPFFTPDGEFARNDQAHILLPWVQLANRTAMDSTGIGLGLFEFLAAKCPGHVIGLNFGGSIPSEQSAAVSVGAQNVKIKTDLAVRLKQRFEQGRNRIPHDAQIRQELLSIKKEYSGGAVKFDAPRIEIDTAVAGGKKRKVFAHADTFWAKAMADFAAAGSPAAALAHADAPDPRFTREPRGVLSELAEYMAAREDQSDRHISRIERGRGSLWTP